MKLDTVPPLFAKSEMAPASTAVLIATGPSQTQDVVDHLQYIKYKSNLALFTLNNTYQMCPSTDVHVSCDEPWWQFYGAGVMETIPNAYKWTYHAHIAKKFPGLKLIGEAWGPGLYTKDQQHIHIGHSSGFMLLNLAYLYGCRTFILTGYDMTYPKAYNGKRKEPGGKRHYFGEYPGDLAHWPTVKVGLSGPGHLDGLIEMYESIDEEALGIKIWNCTPGSVLNCFEKADLEMIL